MDTSERTIAEIIGWKLKEIGVVNPTLRWKPPDRGLRIAHATDPNVDDMLRWLSSRVTYWSATMAPYPNGDGARITIELGSTPTRRHELIQCFDDASFKAAVEKAVREVDRRLGGD